MTITNNPINPEALQQPPYFDDYDPAKGYHRILFRPGRAVQGRELTQSQTLIQQALQRFGASIYKNGSIVEGGQISYYISPTLNLSPTFANTNIDIDQFTYTTVIAANSANMDASAFVVQTETVQNTSPILVLKYFSGNTFGMGDTIKIGGNLASSNIFASVASVNAFSQTAIASIQAGTFFVNGFFVDTEAQTIIIDNFNIQPNVRIGLQLNDSIVTEQQDTSLLDPALGASNYQGPGAGRYKLELELSSRALDSADDTKFIELMRVVDGIITKKITYPTYSELEDTLARRTYDTNGSFTVKPFKLRLFDDPTGDPTLYSLNLDPGKAYVFGYEFATIAPTAIAARRGRDTTAVDNYNLAMSIGNFTIVSGLSGLFNINSQDIADYHCVMANSIVTTNTTTYNLTKLGTMRIRVVTPDSGTNNRIYFNQLTGVTFNGNVQAATSNTITLQQNLSSTVSGAYVGATIQLVSGTGTGLYSIITAYNAATTIVTVAPAFSTIPDVTTDYSIQGDAHSIKSIVKPTLGTPTTFQVSANVVQTPGGNPNGRILLFPVPQNPIVPLSIANQTYEYAKFYAAQNFNSGVAVITAASGEQFIGNGILSDSAVAQNYLVAIKDNHGSLNISNGQLITFTAAGGRTINVSTGNVATININKPFDTFTGDIQAILSIDSGVESKPKSKLLVTGNTTLLSTSSDGTFGSSTVYLDRGQQVITSPNKFPGQSDELFMSDVVYLRQVLDFRGGTVTAGMALPNTAIDVTDHYILNTGQGENFYNHGSIQLKYGFGPIIGPIVVIVDYYQHVAGASDGFGYFTIDSYPLSNTANGYAAISSFTAPTTGVVYNLRDCIDFRPRRKDAENAFPNYTFQGNRLPVPDSSFIFDYSYFLSRIDKLVLTRDRNFKVIEGVSGVNPLPPNDDKLAMTLYQLFTPAYTLAPSNVVVTYIDNRRYTMHDIGVLAQRVSNLEYYTSLSLLESSTYNQSIVDGNGLERTKYGFIVDDFSGSSIADVQNPDYFCALDYDTHQMRPAVNVGAVKLAFDSTQSASVKQTGSLVTMNYNEIPVISQFLASHADSVNPYTFANFIGTMLLYPQTDTWHDVTQTPNVLVNTNGQNDNFIAIGANNGTTSSNTTGLTALQSRYNYWQSYWAGLDPTHVAQQNQAQQVNSSVPINPSASVGRSVSSVTTQSYTTSVVSQGQPTNPSVQIGNFVVDVSVIPFMRTNDVTFVSRSMRPNRVIWHFFDDEPVTNYILKPQRLYFTSNVQFDDTGMEVLSSGNNFVKVLASWGNTALVTNFGDHLGVSDFQPGTTWTGIVSGNSAVLASKSIGSAEMAAVATSNTITLPLYATSNTSNTDYVGFPVYVVEGTGLGQSSVITAYNKNTGVATVSPSWTSNPYNASEFAKASAAGRPGPRVSIGQSQVTENGTLVGTFVIPCTSTERFETGSRILRAIDEPNNNPDFMTTVAESTYFAEGLFETKQSTSISTQPPIIIQSTVISTTIINNTVTSPPVITPVPNPVVPTPIPPTPPVIVAPNPPTPNPPANPGKPLVPPPDPVVVTQPTYVAPRNPLSHIAPNPGLISQGGPRHNDPLAETFFIDDSIFPEGIFISSVDLFFQQKDDTLPVFLQICEVSNGYPDTATALPYSLVTLNPNQVQISDGISAFPGIDSSGTITKFKFHSPVYLAPGQYAIVVGSDSPNYYAWVADLGEKIIGTDRIISQQPYVGSLFKSQNMSTWTAFQTEDLMFTLNRCDFTANTSGTAVFGNMRPTANIKMDTAFVTVQELNTNSTNVAFSLKATSDATGVFESNWTDFIIGQNYDFNDSTGRRVIVGGSTASNGSFQIRATMKTNSPYVSPVIDTQRVQLLGIENIINNGGFENASISIANTGTGYSNLANLALHVSSGNGTGANVYVSGFTSINSQNVFNVVVDVAGSGYKDQALITVLGGGGNGANLILSSEASNHGGNYKVRYITRAVTLAPGFSAGDLQVYLTAYWPSSADIEVYYKILNANDPDSLDNKLWTRMAIQSPITTFSKGKNDLHEFQWDGSATANSIAYTSGTSSYTDFSTFAIKVVLGSTSTTDVPYVNALRAIALPASS